jgi:hypothetical protein
MQGTIASDVARTEMIIKNAEIPGKTTFILRFFVKVIQNKMAKFYVKEYCRISGLKFEELNKWKLPLYVARLNEKNSKKEEEKLIKIIRKEIGKKQTSA